MSPEMAGDSDGGSSGDAVGPFVVPCTAAIERADESTTGMGRVLPGDPTRQCHQALAGQLRPLTRWPRARRARPASPLTSEAHRGAAICRNSALPGAPHKSQVSATAPTGAAGGDASTCCGLASSFLSAGAAAGFDGLYSARIIPTQARLTSCAVPRIGPSRRGST